MPSQARAYNLLKINSKILDYIILKVLRKDNKIISGARYRARDVLTPSVKSLARLRDPDFYIIVKKPNAFFKTISD